MAIIYVGGVTLISMGPAENATLLSVFTYDTLARLALIFHFRYL